MPENHWHRWKGIMKCCPFEEKRLAKWQPPYIVQPKYDGDRCRAIPLDQGKYLPVTSEENPMFSIPHIVQSLNDSPLSGIELDSEAYNHEIHMEGGWELIHSILSRKRNLHPRHREIKLYLVDLKTNEPQMMRLHRLIQIKELNIPYIVVAPFWICESLSDIKKVYDNLMTQKYEGIIVRHLYNQYEEKRSTFVMKFKPKKHDTYKIVGWKEEVSKDGIPKGRIGSVVLSSQSGDTFAVSAGLNDSDREYLWDVRGLISGSMATVHYQHLTNNKIPKGTFDIEIPDWGIVRSKSNG